MILPHPKQLFLRLALAETRVGAFMVLLNDSLGKMLIATGQYEPHFLQVASAILKPGDVCVDIGANLGYHTVTMAKLVGESGVVWAFEPQRIIYQQLCGNCFLNEVRNVMAFPLAIGDRDQLVKIESLNYEALAINTGEVRVTEEGDEVQAAPLDAFDFQRVDFIKADMQGSELKFLTGASRILVRCRPVIFMEVEEPFLAVMGTSSREILNRLLSLNYILVRINAYDKTTGAFPWDHLAVPAEREDKIKDYLRRLEYPHDIIKGKSVEVFFDRDPKQWGSLAKDCYGSFRVTP